MLIAGVDEAGRGPLAGPVVASAVIFKSNFPFPENLTDSKLLSAKKRDGFRDFIKTQALSYAIGLASVSEIDDLNIHHATLLAMRRAVEGLSTMPHHVKVDGKFTPDVSMSCEAIIKGDLTIPVISAASILAKTHRDALLCEYDTQYPQYGFAQHKGYGTKAHLEALKMHGPCLIHRKTFAPVAALLS